MPIQVAFISNDPYHIGAVRQVLTAEGIALHVVEGQTQPHEWLQGRAIDAILVDLDLPAVITLIEEAAARLPQIPLIVVAEPRHLTDLQQAMLAGAAAFVTLPLMPQQFLAILQRVIGAASPGRVSRGPGRVIAVAGMKGGIGRSILAVNLAVALAQRPEFAAGPPIVLTEVHHGLSDLALLLNAHPTHTVANMAAEMHFDADLVGGHLFVHSSGVRLLAAPTAVSQLVDIPPTVWRAVLDVLAQMASVVIVDTAASPDPILAEALAMADTILVVSTPEITAVRGAVALIESLKQESGIGARIHLILNRAGAAGGIGAGAIADHFKLKVEAALVDDPALVTLATNRGVPFVLSHRRALLSRQIEHLAARLAAEIKPQAAAETARPARWRRNKPGRNEHQTPLQRLQPTVAPQAEEHSIRRSMG